MTFNVLIDRNKITKVMMPAHYTAPYEAAIKQEIAKRLNVSAKGMEIVRNNGSN